MLLGILKILLLLLGLVLGYFLLTLLGLLIPIHRKFKPIPNGIELGLSTNGMHTDFVLPIKNEVFDWTQIINVNQFQLSPTKETKIGIGWGDKAVYLDIETWGELTLKMNLC